MRPTVSPGAALPWWIEDALAQEGARVDSPALRGDLDVDVAIVGGGYTGLWTALALRERDPSATVAVLEAEYCGAGPSGRNGGFIEGYWPAVGELRRLFGDEAAVRLARAGEGIRPAVRALGEDVWLREAGMLMVATTERQEAAVEHAVASAASLGRPEQAVPLSPADVAARCASPRFRRGVLFPDTGTVHPGRLVRALRRRALERGVAVHEGTRVTAVESGLVTTQTGRVRAGQVVVATNAAMTDWRPVRGRLTVFGSYIVLTEPVPELVEAIGWTGGEAIVDARMFLHYFRTTNDGRVLMGSGSGPIGRGNRIDRRFTHDVATAGRAELGLRRLLPGLAGAKVERAWGGPIDVSADHLPFFGTAPGGGVHFAAGYAATESGRHGWPARRSPRSRSAGTTTGPGCRSCTAAAHACRASRSATSAAPRSAPRSSPARRPTKRVAANRCSAAPSARCRGCSG